MASQEQDSSTCPRCPMSESLEVRLQATLNMIPAQTWYAASTGALTFVNARSADYLGLAVDHPLRSGIDMGAAWDSHVSLLHPDDHDETRRVWAHCLKTGSPGQVSFRVRDAHGDYRWFIAQTEPFHASDGELLYWIGINLDIEERKQAEFYLAEAQRLVHSGSWAFSASGFQYWSPELFEIHGLEPSCKQELTQALRKSEEKFRLVVDGIDAQVATMAADGAVEFVNQQVLDYFGKTQEEMKSWHTGDAVHPDDRARLIAAWSHSVKTGLAYDVDVRHRRFDGIYRWFRARGRPSRDAQGRIVRWYEVLTDIDEAKKAEESLAAQEMELRQVLDVAPQLIAVLGPNWERWYANSGALAFYGITLEEWRQKDIYAELHPDDVDRARAAAAHALSARSSYELEKRVRSGDGTYRWVLARYKPVCDAQGRATRWYVACTDIDERKRAEERLREENVALREEIDENLMFGEIVGASPALTAVLSRVAKVAASDSTVLITGETGTGKELVARAIHRRSSRSSGPFVAVNCAAIPRELMASELFGHEKGAFTGALQRRLGRFELANGGTMFLDEVAELSPDTQAALLRVVQEREFERVGGRGAISVDVRLIAATNRDLIDAVGNGTFRPDLFYRLNVFPLEMPSLRERKEDIPVLVEYFIHRHGRKAGKTFRRVGKQTLDRLQSYPWPGNVRELQNVIERSVIVCDTEEFTVDESWLSTGRRIGASKGALSSTLLAQEKAMIEEALRASNGRIFGPQGAAERLGIPRSTLDSRIQVLRINKSRFRAGSGQAEQ